VFFRFHFDLVLPSDDSTDQCSANYTKMTCQWDKKV
jgi:hypothetical protein